MRKKIIYLIIILVLGVIIAYLRTFYFSGTEKNIILKEYNEITSLNQLINRPEFNNKELYIDFYSTSCSGAILQFKYFSNLKNDLNKKDLVYVHLAAPTSTYNWKSTIRKHNLLDYNVHMNEEFYNEFWSNFPDQPKVPPFYLFVNKEKKITQYLDPKNIYAKKYINLFFKRIDNYINENLALIHQKLPLKPEKLKIDVMITKNFDIKYIEYFTISKDKKVIKQANEIFEKLEEYINNTNETILNKMTSGVYSKTIPL